MIQPPFKIVAAGILPQGITSGGVRAPNGVGCVITNNGGAGQWKIHVLDETVNDQNSIIVPAPGSGSNLAPGVSFGCSQQVGQDFFVDVYRIDTGVHVDLTAGFIVVKWPPAEVDANLLAGE